MKDIERQWVIEYTHDGGVSWGNSKPFFRGDPPPIERIVIWGKPPPGEDFARVRCLETQETIQVNFAKG